MALSAHPWDGELSPAVSGALDAFVAECRGDGDPPERVLLKLKAIVAEIRGPQSGRRPVSLAEQAFKERLVRHCIESYYARPDDQGS